MWSATNVIMARGSCGVVKHQQLIMVVFLLSVFESLLLKCSDFLENFQNSEICSNQRLGQCSMKCL